MTAPTAPTAEKAERKSDRLPAAETTQSGPVEDLAALSGIGGRLPLGAPQLSHLDPARVMSLQRAAGNHAVSGMIQRAPVEMRNTRTETLKAVDAPDEPEVVPKVGKTTPLVPKGALTDIVRSVPGLIKQIDDGLVKYADTMQAKHGRFSWSSKEEVAVGSVSAVTLFAEDVVYRMDSSGDVAEVESNTSEPDPAKPKQAPGQKHKMREPSVLLMHPSDGQVFLVLIRFKTAVDATGSGSVGLHFLRIQDPVVIPKGIPAGQFILLIYAPNNNAAKEGAQVPVTTSMALDEAPTDVPPKLKKQVSRVEEMLAQMQTPDEPAEDVRGTGVGQTGTGAGGGGESATPVPGGQAGTKKGPAKDAGKGTGQSGRRKRRAKPDRIVPWPTKDGRPMLNVWKNGTAEAIELKDGEKDEDLKKRIEETAGKHESTGKSLADGATKTGFVGGEGGAQATATEMAEATEFNANAASYPSRMEMQGGSGAEISPAGWGTTITGAMHNFDMILDFEARHFGLANQAFARLGWVHYYWQVIDVSLLNFGKDESRTQKKAEQEEDFRQRLRLTAVAGAADKDNVRVAKKLDTYFARGRNKLITEGEGIKKDSPEILTPNTILTFPVKAAELSVMGISAVWNVGKAMIANWFAKATEPENRQEIEFDHPGEFLIRCLANPVADEEKPRDKQTRRATSVAVFPVRVVDVNQRAQESVHKDTDELNQAKAVLAAAQEDLKADPDNEGKQVQVEQARSIANQQQTAYDYSTVEKAGHELEDYDRRIPVLEQLAMGRDINTLHGDDFVIGLELREEIRNRYKLAPTELVAWYRYEYHLHDVKEARKKKAEQKQLATDKEEKVEKSSALRPRVTFVSEENGAFVKMDMILGRAKETTAEKPRWILSDVTTEDTQGSYEGKSAQAGIAGDAEAVTKAFETFAEKAEYGRGTIAIDIPGRPDLMNPGRTMLMEVGAGGRWIARLRSLVEIATIVTAVAPAAEGAQLLGRLADIGQLIEVGARLYDKAAHGQLQANFALLADVVSALAPIGKAAGALSESRLLRQTRSGSYALSVFASGAEYANDFMMPATFYHDLDKIVSDTSLDGPAKRAAIAMLFSRGIKDGLVTVMSKRGGGRHGEEPLGAGHTEGVAPVEPTTSHTESVAGDEQVGGGATPPPAKRLPEPAPRRTDIDGKFDNSDQATAEPAKAKQTEEAPRAAQSETPPVGERAGEPPPTDIPAEQLGIEPGSKLDTPRGRANRAEQMRRAAAWQVDAATVEHGTGPDARARARAADYTPMYAKWTQLKAAGRKEHIKSLINAHLAREGIPPVSVNFGAKAPGNAEFVAHEWTITLSDQVVTGDHITAEAFATLIDNAVHETQHTITTFRGVRMALAKKGYNPQAHIPGKVLGEAITANKRRSPETELDETARGEALEIYEVQVEPRVEGPMPKGALDREAVYARMDAAKEALADAEALHKVNVEELQKAPTDPDLKRYAEESWAAVQRARNEQVEAHNAYVALPEETFSHRAGGGAKEAVLERLGLESRWNDAKSAAGAAARDSRAKKRRGDVKGAAEAMKRSQEADRDALQARAAIDGLASKEPALVGGNIDRRGTPLTQKEIAAAPKAPTKGYAQPGELGRRAGKAQPSGGPGRPAPSDVPDVAARRPAEASPLPGGAKFAPTGAAVETGAEAKRVVSKQDDWAGRRIGSDLPTTGTVQPSAGTGVQYENRRGRYDIVGKPKGGTTDSQIVKDRTTGELYLFKPKTGEKHVPTAAERGVEVGEYAPRAKASEIATHELGLDTPGVELVELEGGTGSLTKWIEPKNKAKPELMSLADYLRPTEQTSEVEATQRLDDLKAKPEFQEAWDNIQALDYLINNVDRYQNFGNYMVEFTPTGEFKRLIPIDSELSFTATEGRAVIERKTSFLEGLTYTQTMADKIRELGANRQAFADKIRPLVGDAAVNGVMERLNALIVDANLKTPAKVPAGAATTP